MCFPAFARHGVKTWRENSITEPSSHSAACREAVERERDVLALLAKLEPAQLTVASAKPGGADNGGGQIELVVADGVEVLLPMAGASGATWPSVFPSW